MIRRGWEFLEVDCGERRFGIGASMKIRRGAEEKTLDHYSDMEYILRREIEEEERKKWEKPNESVRSDLSSPAG
jgi:hypothetical protein